MPLDPVFTTAHLAWNAPAWADGTTRYAINITDYRGISLPGGDGIIGTNTYYEYQAYWGKPFHVVVWAVRIDGTLSKILTQDFQAPEEFE